MYNKYNYNNYKSQKLNHTINCASKREYRIFRTLFFHYLYIFFAVIKQNFCNLAVFNRSVRNDIYI